MYIHTQVSRVLWFLFTKHEVTSHKYSLMTKTLKRAHFIPRGSFLIKHLCIYSDKDWANFIPLVSYK